MASYGEVLRDRRLELGIGQHAVASVAGVDVRTVQRWEKGERPIDFPEPAASVGRLLRLTLDEFAGITPIGVRLSGRRQARWQTWRHGRPVIDRHTTLIDQTGPRVSMTSDGDYNWRAEAEIIGDHVDGTYRSIEIDREFHGSLHLWLSEDYEMMIGHWSGSFFDAPMGIGWGVIATDGEAAEKMIRHLVDRGLGPLESWPELH